MKAFRSPAISAVGGLSCVCLFAVCGSVWFLVLVGELQAETFAGLCHCSHGQDNLHDQGHPHEDHLQCAQSAGHLAGGRPQEWYHILGTMWTPLAAAARGHLHHHDQEDTRVALVRIVTMGSSDLWSDLSREPKCKQRSADADVMPLALIFN